MAQFLHAAGTGAAFIDLVNNSNEFLFIVSPYIKITTQNKNYLQRVSGKGIDLKLIYRSDSKLDGEDEKFFRENRFIQLYTCDNLHAKCYLNEYSGIISSLNLYEHSQANNWEMGVLFNKKDDFDLYENAYKELQRILDASKKRLMGTIPQTSQKPVFIPEKKGFMDKILDATIGPQFGYCIRCRKEMEFNPNRPLCSNCYTIWNKHANPSYKEKFCHYCGKERQTSYEKPICYECFKSDFKYY